MQILLEELLLLHVQSSRLTEDVYLEKMHPLAEEQHEAAKAFFIECLSDKRVEWRYSCLRAVGFHYDLSSDEPTKDKLRHLLLHDPDDLVRSAAASILERSSTWPETALFRSLQTEKDHDVKKVVFLALLIHGGLPRSLYNKFYKLLEKGEIEPTLVELKKTLSSLNNALKFPE